MSSELVIWYAVNTYMEGSKRPKKKNEEGYVKVLDLRKSVDKARSILFGNKSQGIEGIKQPFHCRVYEVDMSCKGGIICTVNYPSGLQHIVDDKPTIYSTHASAQHHTVIHDTH
jgi:hypothetical protein